jgi:hypothetical protein
MFRSKSQGEKGPNKQQEKQFQKVKKVGLLYCLLSVSTKTFILQQPQAFGT